MATEILQPLFPRKPLFREIIKHSPTYLNTIVLAINSNGVGDTPLFKSITEDLTSPPFEKGGFSKDATQRSEDMLLRFPYDMISSNH
jgi:hypothetical protein